MAENLIVECGVESNQIGEAIQRALNKYPDIDSIICTNNVVAYETLKFLKKKNIANSRINWNHQHLIIIHWT